MIREEGSVVKGVYGVERALDKVLRGQDGSESMLVDVHHHGIDSRVDTVERPGTQLTLSIDSRMQYVAEREPEGGSDREACPQRFRNRDEPVYGRNPGDGELPDVRSEYFVGQGVKTRSRAGIWPRPCPSSRVRCSK